jgi:hypothetical protein
MIGMLGGHGPRVQFEAGIPSWVPRLPACPCPSWVGGGLGELRCLCVLVTLVVGWVLCLASIWVVKFGHGLVTMRVMVWWYGVRRLGCVSWVVSSMKGMGL